MRHVETVEARQLFAALTPDPSFGKSGAIPLSTQYDASVLATHGAIYVFGFNKQDAAYYVYKYTDAGKLDTAWGDGGKILPTLTSTNHNGVLEPKLTLVYDPHTSGLLLATGDGDHIDVERYTAAGVRDTAWARHGVFTYSATDAIFTLGSVLPASGKRVDIAFTYRPDGFGTLVDPKNAGTNVELLQLDRRGRRDKAFHDGKPLVVVRGSESFTYSNSVQHANTVTPTFGDLRQTDGGLRVVATSAHQVQAVTSTGGLDGSDYYTGTTTWSVVSTDVSTRGTPAAPVATQLYKDSVTNAAIGSRYTPVLAVANDDGSVAAVFSKTNLSGGSLSAQLARVSADGRVLASGLLGHGIAPVYDFNVYRNADGDTYITAENLTVQSDDDQIVAFRPDLTLDRSFGKAGVADAPAGTIDAVDDNGRLVVVASTISGSKSTASLVRYA